MNARLMFAKSENDANLLYESGFMAPDAFLWYEIDGQASVVVSTLELGRAQKQVRPGIKVICRESLGTPEKKYPTTAEIIVDLSQANGVSQWEIPDNFPFGLAVKLQEAGLELSVKTPFCPERNAKSEAEIAKVSQALRITEAGLNAGLEALRQAVIGKDDILYWHDEILTAEILRGEIDSEICRRGGTAAGTIAAPGPQGADPHQTGFGPLKAHQTIIMDIFPRDNATGYFGDLTRTVVKGTAPDYVHKVFETVRQAQNMTFDSLKPGVFGRDIHNQTVDFFKASGYDTGITDGIPHGFFHGLGHGLGLDIHETPSLNLSQGGPLPVGAVVTVEPGLYYPEWGGVRLEDVAAITDKSCKNLTFAPIFLEI